MLSERYSHSPVKVPGVARVVVAWRGVSESRGIHQDHRGIMRVEQVPDPGVKFQPDPGARPEVVGSLHGAELVTRTGPAVPVVEVLHSHVLVPVIQAESFPEPEREVPPEQVGGNSGQVPARIVCAVINKVGKTVY